MGGYSVRRFDEEEEDEEENMGSRAIRVVHRGWENPAQRGKKERQMAHGLLLRGLLVDLYVEEKGRQEGEGSLVRAQRHEMANRRFVKLAMRWKY